jgi:hypothetical protein
VEQAVIPESFENGAINDSFIQYTYNYKLEKYAIFDLIREKSRLQIINTNMLNIKNSDTSKRNIIETKNCL